MPIPINDNYGNRLMSFHTGGGIMTSSENKIVLNISDDCLKKMERDPVFAKKIKDSIAGIPAAHKQMYAQAKSDGIQIHGFAVRINADGSMQCSCSGSTRTSGAGQSKSVVDAKKQKREKAMKKRKSYKKSSVINTISNRSIVSAAGFEAKA